MKITILTLLTLLSVSNVFAMSESEKTDCKDMVEKSTDKVSSQTPVSSDVSIESKAEDK